MPPPELASSLAPAPVPAAPPPVKVSSLSEVSTAPAVPEAPPAKPARKRIVHARPVERTEKKAAALDPVTLVGMAPLDVGSLLGKPAEMREVAPATQWTYAAQDCSLVIFFYPDLATGALHALKYIVTDARGGPGNGVDCVHHILLARSDSHG